MCSRSGLLKAQHFAEGEARGLTHESWRASSLQTVLDMQAQLQRAAIHSSVCGASNSLSGRESRRGIRAGARYWESILPDGRDRHCLTWQKIDTC